MRIILSRKGFDSSSGGCPSPILQGKYLRSLPIPECCSGATSSFSGTKYEDIGNDDGNSMGDIVESLTKCEKCVEVRIKRDANAHLDPDIDKKSLPRDEGWRGVFGQCGSSQSHLENQGVKEGDLFLFFGLYRQTEGNAKELKFAKGSPEIHTIWGWLQIGAIIDVVNERNKIPAWCEYHPHVVHSERYEKPNVIYISKETLDIPGLQASQPPLSGCNVFPTFDTRLQLTAKDTKNPSQWSLPVWFKEKLSYHSNPDFWSECENDNSKILLNSVGRGQEFVIDISKNTEVASNWLRNIFAHKNHPNPLNVQ